MMLWCYVSLVSLGYIGFLVGCVLWMATCLLLCCVVFLSSLGFVIRLCSCFCLVALLFV